MKKSINILFIMLVTLIWGVSSSANAMGVTLKKPTPKPETNPNPEPNPDQNQPTDPNSPYSYGVKIGENPSGISENSGMVYSKQYNRLYIINDSGNGNYFFVTEMSGKLIEKVQIKNAKNVDFEGLSYASCADSSDKCIYIGDIGDNSEDNTYHHVYIVKEQSSFNKTANLLTDITFSYEDNITPNAESLSVHPISGDIFIATKNYDGKSTFIYKIDKQVFSGKDKVSTVAKYVGEVSYTTLVKSTKIDFTHTTDMSISPNGSKFLLLTDQSRSAWEFNLDLSQVNSFGYSDLVNNFRVIPIDYLGQEESINYLNEDEFIYSTEGDGTPIMKVKINRK